MRYLTLLSLALSLYAQTLFIPQSWIDAEGRYSTEQSYCQNLPAHKAPFCEKSSLSYPVFTQAPDPVVAQQIARIVTPRITEEKKRGLKKEVLSIVSDFKQDPPDGTWYNEESISLFALTPQTFTIRTTISNYTGGAHGSYTVGYTNYLKGDTTNTPPLHSMTFSSPDTKRSSSRSQHPTTRNLSGSNLRRASRRTDGSKTGLSSPQRSLLHQTVCSFTTTPMRSKRMPTDTPAFCCPTLCFESSLDLRALSVPTHNPPKS